MEYKEFIEILKPDFEFKDDRGSLTQLVSCGFSQINVIRALSGCKRGGHYHRVNDEAFYVIDGSLTLVARFDNKEKRYEFKKGDMFLIKRCVAHDLIFTSETLMVSMYDKGVEIGDGEMDIYKG